MASSLSPRSFSVVAVALAASAALALSGCGQSSPADDEGAGEAQVAPPAILTEDALQICANFATPPNIYAEDDGDPIGTEVDIAKAMSAELGLSPDFLEYNFSGLVPALQAQQCDVIMSSLYIRPEREEIANFVPYLKSGTAVLVAEDNPEGITGYDDSLCGKTVLAFTGATGAIYSEEMSEECEESGMEPLNITLSDNVTALQQVLAGQVDAAIDTAELAGYYENLGDFQLVGEPFGEIIIGAATLKDNTELNEALQEAFDAVVASGEYDEILEEWGMANQSIEE